MCFVYSEVKQCLIQFKNFFYHQFCSLRNETFFSALRLALQIQEQHKANTEIKLFLMSDAVTAGLAKQNPAEGYHIQQMLEILNRPRGNVNYAKPVLNAEGLQICL